MQRKLSVGYARAARIIDQLEDLGIVEGHVGSKARNIIMNEEEIKNLEIYNK
jgi:S-DNA-T family DNA segregation ATPase FtsK/SpoIIIE